METDRWLLFIIVGIVVLQLGSLLNGILRSLQSTESMTRRLLEHQGIPWGVVVPPSAGVRELALRRKDPIAALEACRERTGLGVREAKAVIDELRARERVLSGPG